MREFAVAEWLHPPVFGETIGQALLVKRDHTWHVMAAGGGAYTVDELHRDFGVPSSIARELEERLPEAMRKPR